MEILAIQRDQAFGSRSELTVPGTNMEDINPVSLQTYRRRIQQFNSEFVYNNLNDEDFCRKIGIAIDGCLTFGSLLMFGKYDSILKIVNNFWIDSIWKYLVYPMITPPPDILIGCLNKKISGNITNYLFKN